jgi:hypothetical protein
MLKVDLLFHAVHVAVDLIQIPLGEPAALASGGGESAQQHQETDPHATGAFLPHPDR